MTLLFLRTDTTGIFNRDRPPSDPAQPRMMRIEAMLVSKKWETVGAIDMLVRPDGWVPNAGASAAHGITPRQCELYGVRPHAVLACFMDMVRAATEIAAFGLDFHAAVIKRELVLLGGVPDVWVRGGMQRTCVMRLASDKWNSGRTMKLEDAYNRAYPDFPDYGAKMERTVSVLKALRNG